MFDDLESKLLIVWHVVHVSHNCVWLLKWLLNQSDINITGWTSQYICKSVYCEGGCGPNKP